MGRGRTLGCPHPDLVCVALPLPTRLLVSASQDGKLIIWDSYTTNKVKLALEVGRIGLPVPGWL